MTHLNHPKSIVYIRVQSFVHSVGLDKCIMTCIHHYGIIQNVFTTLKLCALPVHLFQPSSSSHPALMDLFTVSIILLFQNAVVKTSTICRDFSDCFFFHLIICIYSPSMFFLGLIAHLFLVLNHIPLSDIPQLIYPFTY